VIDGLKIAAHVARHQAGICRYTYDSRDAEVLEQFAKTLEAMATQEEAKFENEPTEPRIQSVRCPKCGTDVMVRW
jgi:ribosomal protein S27AE